MAAVTLVIPVLNREKYLPDLFRSLSAVTYEELEIILIDNGSTDRSLSLCRGFADDAPMVVSVLEEPQQGASRARNRGLEACQTEWIYFFDSDDELSPSFLEEVIPQTDDFDMILFPTLQEVKGKVAQRAFIARDTATAQILSSTLNTQGMLFRTDFLRKIGGWNETLSIWDDWELGIRALLNAPRILWQPRQAYHLIHVHDDSLTGSSMSSRRNKIEQVMSAVSQKLRLPTDYRALFLRYCIVNGQLQHEGGHPIPVPVSASLLIRTIGRLLRFYTAHGGRGAWRIALWFC
ncbi:MAG: glycosyltransferase family 2 protein [Bacteroidaceae bacterium]|nr:glycosyltransferase family 2 protein [Bacteroidaceae bacterium]